MVISDIDATSDGDLAAVAPASNSDDSREGFRSYAVRGYPEEAMCPAIGSPMIPRPMKPILSDINELL
jgi:hypothetical protein